MFSVMTDEKRASGTALIHAKKCSADVYMKIALFEIGGQALGVILGCDIAVGYLCLEELDVLVEYVIIGLMIFGCERIVGSLYCFGCFAAPQTGD